MSGEDWFALAKAGDLDGVLELAYADVEGEDTEEADAQAYKWLVVALDFGHAKAEDLIADLYEGTSLRYDDDQFVAGETHLDLGVAYLLGSAPFAKDLAKGREHLQQADECGFPASVEGGEEMLAEIRGKLPADSLAVFDEIYPRT